jgi:hypothetical protein
LSSLALLCCSPPTYGETWFFMLVSLPACASACLCVILDQKTATLFHYRGSRGPGAARPWASARGLRGVAPGALHFGQLKSISETESLAQGMAHHQWVTEISIFVGQHLGSGSLRSFHRAHFAHFVQRSAGIHTPVRLSITAQA